MDRDQTYFELFLKTANPYRFGTEKFAMPRMKKTIRHANSVDDLARGYRVGGHGPYALKRLDSHGWSNKKQWAWSKAVINGVASMEVAAGDVAEMLNSHSSLLNKKQVVVEQSLKSLHNPYLSVDQP